MTIPDNWVQVSAFEKLEHAFWGGLDCIVDVKGADGIERHYLITNVSSD